MEHNYHIDEQLKRLLESMEAQPDIRSFDMVIRKMEHKKKRRGFILFWTGLAMLLLVPLVFLWLSAGQRPASSVAHRSGREQAQSKTSSVMTEPAAPAKPAALMRQTIAHLPAPVSTGSPAALMHSSPVPGRAENSGIPPVSQQKNSPAAGTDRIKNEDNTAPDQEPTLTIANDSVTWPAENLSGKDPGEKYAYLPPKMAGLADTLPEREATLQLPLPYSFPSVSKQKSSEFYWGFSLNPQLGSFLAFENRGLNLKDTVFLEQARQDQYNLKLQYAFGIKAGRIYREKYELFASLGFQRLQGRARNYNSGSFYSASPAIPAQFSNQAVFPKEAVYRYSYLAVEVARLYRHRSFKLRLAAGLQFNYALYSMKAVRLQSLKPVLVNYNMDGTVARWHNLAHLKFGITRQLGKKMQVQLNPGVFCALNSVFYKQYILRQYPYGFQLEAVLLFGLEGKAGKPSPGP